MNRVLLDKKLLVYVTLLVLTTSIIPYIPRINATSERIYVAFIWHYHQPWYYSPDETYFILPWVRMHSVGNYYKMAYILSKYPEIRVTFTFSGSLLEQLVDMVENNKMDVREMISWRVVNGTVSREDVFNMLRIPGGFFDINWARIVNRSPRFRELRDLAMQLHTSCSATAKTDIELVDCVFMGFTNGNPLHQNVIDLATLFNLLWIDPLVASEQYLDVYQMMTRAYNSPRPGFTREELRRILIVHRDIMKNITPIYRELVKRGQVELIPVPYSHPLAPLLTASGLSRDLEIHVRFSFDLFKKYFNYTPRGVWPAEQAVNEHVVHAFRRAGAIWTVTDSSLLIAAGFTPGIEDIGRPWFIDFPEGRIYVFFRETELSNLISFQYSGWDQDRAVEDLINRIRAYRDMARGPRVVVIALDGENPWEHYPEFGTIFLTRLYSRLRELQGQGVIETLTPGLFIDRFRDVARDLPSKTYSYLDLVDRDIANTPSNSYGDAYTDLPRVKVTARLPEGSWGGGEVAIWIGHRQENVAWMWLIKTREDILGKLGVRDLGELYDRYPHIAKYLLKAQASDWWWWYGGDGGGSPAPFDPLYKAYLAKAYELSGLTPPAYLRVMAYPDGTPIDTLNPIAPALMDKAIRLDGVIEDTWNTLIKEGKAVNLTVGSIVPRVILALNTSTIHIAMDIETQLLNRLKIAIYFATPNVSMSPYNPGYNVYPRGRNIDLGIHLAREILIDPAQRTIRFSRADGRGGWVEYRATSDLFVGGTAGRYTVELVVGIVDTELATGQPAYFTIVVYEDMAPVEWSSRIGLTHQIHIPMPPPELVGRVLIKLDDPVGDDDGVGGFGYPRNPVFTPGVFDLTKFTVIDIGDRLVFKIHFRELGGNPWGGPNGWSLQQIHVYIKTTLGIEGRREAIALNFIVEHGWHMALLIAPGWGTDPLPSGERAALYHYDKETPVVQDGDLKAYADHAVKAIIVEVSKNILYDQGNVDKWLFVVAVTSHDGYGVNRIRPFVIGGGEWQVDVPSTYAMAILKNVLPFVMDILASTREEQYSMLRSFNPDTGQLAVVRGFGKRIPPVETPIPTPRPEPTPTPTPISTPTPTPTPTPMPVTTTPTPTPTPIPQQRFPDTWVIVISIIVVSLAIIVVFVVKRKR